MFALKDTLKFININQDYLKALHEVCAEVYYKPFNYETKPYLGILVSAGNQEYAIPLSSAKEKHKTWKDIDSDRFLIFENCTQNSISKNAVYTENADGTVKHILSVIDLKKMIPIKSDLYKIVDLNAKPDDSTEIRNYKNLMNKEYSFCLKIISQISAKASKLYEKQMKTGKVIKFCCDFKLLEEKCAEWEKLVKCRFLYN